MIPAPSGIVARYVQDGEYHEKQVVAFDSDLYPLVMSESGVLVRAEALDGFDSVADVGRGPQFVSLIPAQRWRAEWDDDGTSEKRSVWIIGWALRTDGITIPLGVDEQGYVEQICPGENVRIYHIHDVPPSTPPVGCLRPGGQRGTVLDLS